MKKWYALLAVPAMLLAMLVPGAAQAAGREPATAAADGNFYAYEHINYGGVRCVWVGNDADWDTCSPGGNMQNRASSVWNNGFAGGRDEVNLHYNESYGGAWICVPVGTAIPNLVGYTFNLGSGRDGYGQGVNDDVASHRWVVTCGNAS